MPNSLAEAGLTGYDDLDILLALRKGVSLGEFSDEIITALAKESRWSDADRAVLQKGQDAAREQTDFIRAVLEKRESASP